MVFSDLDDRSTLFVVDFDPQKGEIAGQPRELLKARGITSIDLSPDARRIAFSQQGQPWEWLGVIATDGSGWARLTDDDYYHRVPAWSPDGRRLVFYLNRGGQALWTLQADGSGLSQLEMPGERENRFRGAVYPVWSPDGRQILFATNTTIEIVDISSSPFRVTASRTYDALTSDYLPSSGSPDGRRLAFSGRGLANRDQLWVFDANLENSRSLGVEGKSPMWLPDSRRLLFAGRNDLFVLDVASLVRQVVMPNIRTDKMFWGRLVSLSRDGRTLAYLASQSDGDVWLMRIEDRGR